MSKIITKLERTFEIIGTFCITPRGFNFYCYSNDSPLLGEDFIYEGKKYICTAVRDATDDDEREQGLSYDKVYFELEEFDS